MDMSKLYRQVIMEHYKNPVNKGLIADKDYLLIHMDNPSCGDKIDVQLKVNGNKIVDIRHEGVGCSICCSAASIASQTLKDITIDEGLAVINEYYELVKGLDYNENILTGEALAYQGVSQFPARIKCATLAWKAIETGLVNIKDAKE